MKRRKKEKSENIEVRRQVFHLFLGIAIITFYMLDLLTKDILMAVFVVGLALSLLSFRFRMPIIHWFLKNFERESDLRENPGKGPVTYVGGSLLALILFPESVALAAIAILAVGDSVSHMVGKYFGKAKYRKKSRKHIEGTIAGIFCASVASSFFIGPQLAFIASTIAMLVESIEIKIGSIILDDNLTIPLAAGLAVYFVQVI